MTRSTTPVWYTPKVNSSPESSLENVGSIIYHSNDVPYPPDTTTSGPLSKCHQRSTAIGSQCAIFPGLRPLTGRSSWLLRAKSPSCLCTVQTNDPILSLLARMPIACPHSGRKGLGKGISSLIHRPLTKGRHAVNHLHAFSNRTLPVPL
jgi:hypothetical protein